MKQQITRITDILRRDDGISGAMHYTEQISWILFLKFLDDFEIRESENAFLDGKNYDFIIEEKFRFKNWIALPSWDDIKDFVNKELFPYLKSFKNINEDYHSMKYKIWEIFSFIENRIDSGHSLKRNSRNNWFAFFSKTRRFVWAFKNLWRFACGNGKWWMKFLRILYTAKHY